MTRLPLRLLLTVLACAFGAFPQTSQPAAQAPSPSASGGRQGRGGLDDTARWDSGAAQRPGMWYQIELPDVVTVTELQLDSAAPGSGFLVLTPPLGQTPRRGRDQAPTRGGFGLPSARGPVAYTLQLSMDGTTWGTPVAHGAGETPTTVIPFTPAQARFIRITQTGAAANGEYWGIHQVRLYGRSGH